MSVIREDGTKIMLPRRGPDHLWNLIHRHFAEENPQKWKYLAMLALRENAGWTLERIAALFGHSKGHVSRCLEQIKMELRHRFEMSPDFLEFDEEPTENLES